MNSSKRNNERLRTLFMSSVISILFHLMLITIIIAVADLPLQKAMVNPVATIEFDNFESKTEIIEDKLPDTETPDETILPESNEQLSLTELHADTTTLDQLYAESTINVSIKYPKGWTFIDQNVKNKLDGVTFWANDGNYNPPPYIHLEVREKDHFLESRYTNKLILDNCTAYFNDPEKIEEYIIQNVYLRTESENDFNIKLMISGEEAFKTFQPRFFGMIKSFNF